MLPSVKKFNSTVLVHYSKIISIIWAILMTFDVITTQIDLRIGHGLIEGNSIMTDIVAYPFFELIGKYLLVLIVFGIFSLVLQKMPNNYHNYFWILYICTIAYLCIFFGYILLNNIHLGILKLSEIGVI